ncbi:hypothetical protein [Leptolyngbya sp. 7M]|uniref:hypothetical protein n=1 Tax=Leptolyngbya sp. 7M TaxID=2812896 RepID=UPI001B8CFAFD|nr:hypothetical protein [Leptolyngbya sp. 7M]QYO65560.1 hypothetical protein JVX88_01875 [Leptolyngbya sp. 7M]
MEHLVTLGFVFLNLFMIVGSVDLFYYHLWKYKLHTRPESRYEHKLHMAFAFLMVPIGYFLYYQNLGGIGLWVALFLVIAALGIEMLDVFSENSSRASLGGLTTGEYSLHVTTTILKVASFAFMFASKPLYAWSLSASAPLPAYGAMGEMIAIKVMVGSLLVGVLHAALLNKRFADVARCETIGRLVGCRTSCCTQ